MIHLYPANPEDNITPNRVSSFFPPQWLEITPANIRWVQCLHDTGHLGTDCIGKNPHAVACTTSMALQYIRTRKLPRKPVLRNSQ